MKMATWVHTLHSSEFFYEFENFISSSHFFQFFSGYLQPQKISFPSRIWNLSCSFPSKLVKYPKSPSAMTKTFVYPFDSLTFNLIPYTPFQTFAMFIVLSPLYNFLQSLLRVLHFKRYLFSDFQSFTSCTITWNGNIPDESLKQGRN